MNGLTSKAQPPQKKNLKNEHNITYDLYADRRPLLNNFFSITKQGIRAYQIAIKC